MIKPSKVKFISPKLEKEFDSLKDNDPIKKSLMRAIKNLQENAYAGIQAPKRLIPEVYIKKYRINNLWKYDLSGEWRLVYTLTAENEIELISAILEWFDTENCPKPRHLCRGSCKATSSFLSPKIPNKPHTLVCGKTQEFFDSHKSYEKRFNY